MDHGGGGHTLRQQQLLADQQSLPSAVVGDGGGGGITLTSRMQEILDTAHMAEVTSNAALRSSLTDPDTPAGAGAGALSSGTGGAHGSVGTSPSLPGSTKSLEAELEVCHAKVADLEEQLQEIKDAVMAPTDPPQLDGDLDEAGQAHVVIGKV